MSHLKNTGFADRISAQQEAKKAMLAKFKAKPTVQDPDFDKREEQRAAELEAVRAARAEAKEQARLEAVARQEAIMAVKRAERKERKQVEAAEMRMRKEEKAQARDELRALGKTSNSKADRAHQWASLWGN
jgi:erythromycin esterase-like protein